MSEEKEDHGDPEARARQICLRLLTLAPRTRAQLADALRKKDIPDDAAEAVLGRFELKQRGGAADELRVAIDEGLSPEDELAAARRLVAARLPGTRGQPAPQRMRRLAGQLARKGYPAGLAFRVIREALEGEEDAAALDDEPPFDEAGL